MKDQGLVIFFRWLARILSLASCAMLLLFIFSDIASFKNLKIKEAVGLLFFPLGVMAGMLIAFKNEAVGSLIGLISLFCFYTIYGLLLTEVFPRGWWFLFFSSPLFFYLVAWLISKFRASA